MNERIRELARQAGVYFGEAHVDYFGDEHPSYISTREMDVEKFAELIVRECAKNAVLFADSTTIQGLPSKHIENYMLKHFGVEE